MRRRENKMKKRRKTIQTKWSLFAMADLLKRQIEEHSAMQEISCWIDWIDKLVKKNTQICKEIRNKKVKEKVKEKEEEIEIKRRRGFAWMQRFLFLLVVILSFIWHMQSSLSYIQFIPFFSSLLSFSSLSLFLYFVC